MKTANELINLAGLSKSTTLTAKGHTAVSRVKTTYANLLTEGYTHQNAFDRTAHDRCGNVPASVIIFAIGTPSNDDLDDMRKQGYSE